MVNLMAAMACAIVFALAHATARARAPTVPITSNMATANGVQLHYLRAGPENLSDTVNGDATPVVLLHGYTETSRMWRPLMPRLATDRPVIAVDLRGIGGSSKPVTGYDKKTAAQDIHALVRAMGWHRVAIAGHDIGLMVAYAYAAQYPDEVERIALMDAFLPGVGDWQKVWLLRDKWHFNFYGDTPLKLVKGRERIFFEHFWNDFAADPAHSLPEADRRFYARQYAQPGGMAAGFEYFHAFEQDASDFAGFAKTPLPMPMLVLAGEKASGEFLVNQGRAVAGNVEGIVIPGAGHWLMEEAPGPTMDALVRFLKAGAP
jgi:pimeloyl-ACP methyl ester carboxylesterase